MALMKKGSLKQVFLVSFSLLLLARPLVAAGPEEVEERARVNPESVRRAEIIHQIYHDQNASESLKKALEANPKIKDFLKADPSKDYKKESPEVLEELSRTYAKLRANEVEGGRKALIDAMTSYGAKQERMAEVDKMLNEKGKMGQYLQKEANGLTAIDQLTSDSKVPAAQARRLLEPGGAWDVALGRPETVDTTNNAEELKNRLEAISSIHAKSEEAAKFPNGQRLSEALQHIAQIAARDPKIASEVSKIVENMSTPPAQDGLFLPGENQDALIGYGGVVLRALEFAEGKNSASSRTELAKAFAGEKGAKDPAKVKKIADAIEKAENESFAGSKKDLQKKLGKANSKTKAIHDAVKEAGSMDQLIAALDKGIEDAKSKGDHNLEKKLRELREEIVAKRLMLALRENENFQKMEPDEQLNLTACALRGSGLLSKGAKLAACTVLAAGLTGGAWALLKDRAGVKEKTPQALYEKMPDPQSLFSKDNFPIAGEKEHRKDAGGEASPTTH